MIISIANDFGTILSSRTAAANLRKKIIENGGATLDFTAVEVVSHSFADELFAVLIQNQGDNWFSNHVKVEGMKDDVRHSILQAISMRCPNLL